MLSCTAQRMSRRLATASPSVRPLVFGRPAVLHTSAVARKDAAAVAATQIVPAAATTDPEKTKSSGSRHWAIERGLATASLVLVPAAVFVPSAPVDYALGVVLPLHAYYGLESSVIDYLPKRKVGMLHHIALNSVRLATALTMYGLYELNANDIGITNAVKALWSI